MKRKIIALSVSLGLTMSVSATSTTVVKPTVKNHQVGQLQHTLPPVKDELVLPDILNPEIGYPIHNEFERKGPTIQVAILLDTSGSMGGLINQARFKIWDIIKEISKANKHNKDVVLEVGLIQYGTAEGNNYSGYSRVLNPLSSDLDSLSENLFSLRISGSREYSGFAINEAVQSFNWSDHPDDLRMIVIAGNESFDQGDVSYEYAIGGANQKEIIVNTIFCGEYQQGVNFEWKNAAVLSKGKYLNINHNNKVRHIVTPYDQEINSLGDELNDTFITYGAKGLSSKSRQLSQDSMINSVSESALAVRNVAKASSSYDSSSWDLVGKFEDNEEEAVALAKKEPEYKSLTEDEIKQKLEKESKERDKIKKKISELEKKRSEFIKESKAKEDKDDFGSVLLEALTEQAKNKGFEFK